MPTTIAIIAAGEMGAAIGRRLALAGARVTTSLAGRSAVTIARAERAGLVSRASDDDLVSDAAIVLSIVPPAEAPALARRLQPSLARAANKPVYVDCNAVAPDTACAIAAQLAETGAPFVDAGIIGPPPADEGTRTILYLSGEAAARAAELGNHGLTVRVLDGPVGAASALKMAYAGITKGLTAIGAATMLSAVRAGCDDALQQELAESQPQLARWLSHQVPRMFAKAHRFVGEMEEIAEFVTDDPAASDIYRAMGRLYQGLAADTAGEATDRLARFSKELMSIAKKDSDGSSGLQATEPVRAKVV